MIQKLLLQNGTFFEQLNSGAISSASKSGTGSEAISYYVQQFLNWSIVFGIISCIFLLLVAGFKFTTSGGDPEKIKEARETAVNAVIGFVVVIMSVAILNIAYGIVNLFVQ